MKVEVDVDIKDIKEAVAKVIARKIYDENATSRIFGFKDHTRDAIQKQAELIFAELPETKKEIKRLLSDKKFIKECAEKVVQDAVENYMLDKDR